MRAGRDGHVRTVHAARDGDAEIRAQARRAGEAGGHVVVVTADRFLQSRVQGAGGIACSDRRWLWTSSVTERHS